MTVRLCAVIAAASVVLALPVAAQDSPVRAHWVQAASLQSPEAVRRMVGAAADDGRNTLFVPVHVSGPGFDALMETVEAAHERGLRVHAWLQVNLVSNGIALPAAREHVIYQRPEWLMVPRELAPELLAIDVRSPEYLGRLARWTRANADRVDGLYVSPLHAGAQDLLAATVRELVSAYDVDGVHLDSIRFPAADFDYSRAAVETFRAEMRARLPAAEVARLEAIATIDPFAYPEERAEDWRLFRQARLTALVTRLRSTARGVRPRVLVSAAIAPDATRAARDSFQDWRTWLDNGFIDALCPVWDRVHAVPEAMRSQFAALVANVRALAGSRPVWVRD